MCDVTNTGKQLCVSPNEPFVLVLEKGLKRKKFSLWSVLLDFLLCRSLYAQTYTLTKILKVKKHNRTPLRPAHICLSLPTVTFTLNITNVPGYVCNHGSPRERDAASKRIWGTPSAISSSESYV